jgi:hypothetical protein
VDDVGTVDVETPSEQLVHEILAVVIREVLSRVNNFVHISLHQISDDVDILVTSGRMRFLYIHQPNDILVVEEF